MPIAKDDVISRLELRLDYLSARNFFAEWAKAAGITDSNLSPESLTKLLHTLKASTPHADRAIRSLCRLGGLDVEAFLAAPAPEPTPAPAPVVKAAPAPEPPPAPAPPPPPAPEPVVEAAPEPEPEPVVEAAPAPEPEPVVEAAPAPEPEPAPEPTYDAE